MSPYLKKLIEEHSEYHNEQFKKKISIRTKLLVPIIIGFVLLGALAMIVQKSMFQQQELTNFKLTETIEDLKITAKIKSQLEKSLTLIDNLSNGSLIAKESGMPRLALEELFSQTLLTNEALLSIKIAFEPNAFDNKDNRFKNSLYSDSSGRFISHLQKTPNLTVTVEPLKVYDDKSKEEWYSIPKKTLRSYFSNPYYDIVNGKETYITSFSVPVIKQNHFIGVIAGTIAIDYLQEILNQEVQHYQEDSEHNNVAIYNQNNICIAHSKNQNLVGRPRQDSHQTISENESTMLTDEQKDLIILNTPLYFQGMMAPWTISTQIPLSYLDKKANQTLWSSTDILMLVALSIVLLMFFIFLINKYISRLESLTTKAQRISIGDLSVKIKPAKSKDEIAVLNFALRQMIDNLKIVTTVLKNGASHVTGASSEIRDGAAQLSSGNSEQAASTEEVTVSIQEMIASIAENKNSAEQTKSANEVAAQKVKETFEKTGVAISSMRKISEKISRINEIASQTTLIALNASIEAARAGQSGKGFAVVAHEVQQLATISKQAAEEIENIFHHGVDSVENAGSNLKEVVPHIEETAKLLHKISVDSLSQNTHANQIGSAMNQLSILTQKNSTFSEELAASSEELNTQSNQLKEVSSFFYNV